MALLARRSGCGAALGGCSGSGSGSSSSISSARGRPVLRCQASKTTSSRTTSSRATGSSSSSSSKQDRSNGGDGGNNQTMKALRERLDGLVQLLTPQQEGDVGDILMMSLSMAVLVWMSMQLYRLYLYASLYHASMDVML